MKYPKQLKALEDAIHSKGLLLPLDVLLVGATGVGKSSTINALFGNNVAKVGEGTDPETQVVAQYKISDYFRIHDSAGLGDSIVNDKRHSRNIIDILTKTVSVDGDTSIPYGYIDLVTVILDGGSRDLGTSYKLLQDIILPVFDPKRITVLINQADMGMSGRYWNEDLQRPEPKLEQFLEEKAISVQERIKEATGLSIHKPICYSAYHEYNVDKILEHIKNHLPAKRRLIKIDQNTKQFIF